MVIKTPKSHSTTPLSGGLPPYSTLGVDDGQAYRPALSFCSRREVVHAEFQL